MTLRRATPAPSPTRSRRTCSPRMTRPTSSRRTAPRRSGRLRSGFGFLRQLRERPRHAVRPADACTPGGERQARRANPGPAGPRNAGGSPARYIAAEKPPEAGYFPAEHCRPTAGDPEQVEPACCWSKPKGNPSQQEPPIARWTRRPHRTNSTICRRTPWQPSSASLGGHRVGNIFTDFWHWLTPHLADDGRGRDHPYRGWRSRRRGWSASACSSTASSGFFKANRNGDRRHRLGDRLLLPHARQDLEDVIAGAQRVLFISARASRYRASQRADQETASTRWPRRALQNIKPMADGCSRQARQPSKKPSTASIAKVEPGKPLNQLAGRRRDTSGRSSSPSGGAAGPGSPDGASSRRATALGACRT